MSCPKRLPEPPRLNWSVLDVSDRLGVSGGVRGPKAPPKQPKRNRLWLDDGSCVRLRAERTNHVWSYDLVHHRTDDGRAFRILNILDEYSRECLVIRVKRKLNSTDVIDALTDLFILRGVPSYIRSDNGPECVAEAARKWIAAVGAKPPSRSSPQNPALRLLIFIPMQLSRCIGFSDRYVTSLLLLIRFSWTPRGRR